MVRLSVTVRFLKALPFGMTSGVLLRLSFRTECILHEVKNLFVWEIYNPSVSLRCQLPLHKGAIEIPQGGEIVNKEE